MSSPSAICTINGTTLPVSGTTGINVAAGSTITIALASIAGVNSWSINCTETDGKNPNSTPALINATKIVDPVNFVATFTAPNTSIIDGYVYGAAMQFTSTVNQGQWNQNTVTMGVWILGPNQIRMFFNGETFESDATNGVAPDLNKVVSETPNATAATATVPGSIYLTKDLGGVFSAPLVVGLQGNPIQSGVLGSSQDGYVLQWSASANQWQIKPPEAILANGVTLEFANLASADIGGYDQLLTSASNAEADLNAVVNNGSGQVLIEAFATPANSPNITYIPPGLWQFDYYRYVSSGAGITNIVFNVYKRSGSTETLLFTVTGAHINDTTPTYEALNYSYPTETFVNATDRIVIKVYAQTTSGSNITTHFVFDGTVHASHVHTPITGSAIQLGGDLTGNTGAAVVVSLTGSSGVVTGPATAITIGSNPATLGKLRLPNSTGIYFRNALNSANIQTLLVDSSNNVLVGDGTNNANVNLNAATGSTANMQVANTSIISAASTGATVGTTTTVQTINGSVLGTTRTITTDLTVDTTTNDYSILCNFSVSHTVTLPSPVNGRELIITDIGGNLSSTVTLTIARHASESIGGVAANLVSMVPFSSFQLVSDGTNWNLVN